MDRNDQQAIEDLFRKLAAVERNSPARDPEAEAFIRQQIARHPGAPYYMAQTIIVQEQALEAAQARIEELEGPAKQGTGGGLFNNIFGDGTRPTRSTSVPRVGRTEPAPAAQRQGGGFLAGAAQTAMGVAGGLLLGNAIAGMLGGGNEAQAADQDTGAQDQAADEPQIDNADYDTGGFDDGGFDGGLDI